MSSSDFVSNGKPLVAIPPASGLAAATDGAVIDTLGWRWAHFSVLFGATRANGTVTVQQSEDGIVWIDIEDDFTTIGTTQKAELAWSDTALTALDSSVVSVRVDAQNTQQYLRMSVAPGGPTDLCGVVILQQAHDARQVITEADKQFTLVLGHKKA